MAIIGCDLHSRYQQIAMPEFSDGEIVTRRLEHENGEAPEFYARLPKRSLIGIQATGYTQWFERLLAKLGHELWVSDPAEIRAWAPEALNARNPIGHCLAKRGGVYYRLTGKLKRKFRLWLRARTDYSGRHAVCSLPAEFSPEPTPWIPGGCGSFTSVT